MKSRVAILALVLAGVAAGAVWVAGGLTGKPDELRMALLWALPAAVFLCARFTVGRRRAAPSLRAALRRSPWIGLAIALDLAPIGVGYLLDWLTLTYGDQTLAATRGTTALWALPLLLLVAIRFWEGTLRGALFEVGQAAFGVCTAAALSVGCGVLLALPALAPGFAPLETPFFAAGLATAAAREIVTLLLYRDAGLVAAGIYRGALAYVDGYLIHDWMSPLFPSANYVTSSDLFYLVRVAGPAAAVALVWAVVRRKGAAA